MKYLLSFLLIISCATASTQVHDWGFSIGSSGPEVERVTSMTSDSQGNLYVTGLFYNTADFDPGMATSSQSSSGDGDIFLAKYDENGGLIWVNTFGSSAGTDRGTKVAFDNQGNLLLTGDFRGTVDFDPSASVASLTANGMDDVFCAKYDQNGNYIWAFSLGSPDNEEIRDLTVDSNNDIVIIGDFESTIDFDPSASTSNLSSIGNEDVFVAKYDENGLYQWAFTVGGTSIDRGLAIATDNSNNIYIGGEYVGTVDFDPSGSTFNLTSSGNKDAFLGKYDPTGNFIWAGKIGGSDSDELRDLQLDGNGDIIITGIFQSTDADFDMSASTSLLVSQGIEDVFMAKYSASNGALNWAISFGNNDMQWVNNLSIDQSNSLYLTGQFVGSVDFDPSINISNISSNGNQDVYLAKYDENGNFTWAFNLGDADPDKGWAVLASEDEIYLSGEFNSSIDTDPGSSSNILNSNGGSDFFIAKYLQPSGCQIVNYPFNGNANDESGWGNDGTVFGATLVNDRFGNPNSAYSFDGVDDYIEVQNLNFSGELTLNYWCNQTVAGHIAGLSQAIDANNRWHLTNSTTSMVAFNEGNSNPAANYTANYSASISQWTMYSFVIDNANSPNKVSVFANGDSLTTITDSAFSAISAPFNIGRHYNKNPAGWIYGEAELDDINVFSCALSEYEIDSIYQSQSAASYCGYSVGAIVSPPTCIGGSDGAIDMTFTGGLSPHSFQWNTGQTTEDLIGVQSGQYSVTISDNQGCDTTVSFTINPPSGLTLNVTTVDATCGSDDGSASVVVNGGTSPYDYNWTNGDTLSTADTLSAGLYMVTVTDDNGCTMSETFNITSSNGPTISSTTTAPSCVGDNDGAIDITVSGGVAPYSYQWNNGATTEDLSGITAGAYDIEVVDDSGCVASATIFVQDPTSIDLSSSTITDPTCGSLDGEITVSASGGAGGFSYQWDANAGNQTGQTATGLGAGVYHLTVTDANGCTASQAYSLSNPNAPNAIVQSSSPVGCNGTGGTINIEIASGTPPFTYVWSNGATTQDLIGVQPGVYDVTVTDGNGCVDAISVTLGSVQPLNQSICLVTVDSVTNTNLLVWEKPSPANEVAYYNIYREGSAAGVYTLVDTVHYSSLSQWTDPTANPQIRGWRYKVAPVDSCGVESQLSVFHKTVHLTENLGLGGVINLIWDSYQGFTFPTWYINRYHPSTGWQVIDSIPSTLYSYTDANPPGQGNLVYTVEGRPNPICTSTRAINHNTTRSNRVNPAFTTGILESSYVENMGIYPNPSEGLITLSATLTQPANIKIRMIDINGRVIQSINRESGVNVLEKIDVSSVERGVYLMEILIEGERRVVRFVRE